MTEKRRRCFNCEAPNVYKVTFCRDCWRMALITSVLSGSGSELLHRLLGMLLP